MGSLSTKYAKLLNPRKSGDMNLPTSSPPLRRKELNWLSKHKVTSKRILSTKAYETTFISFEERQMYLYSVPQTLFNSKENEIPYWHSVWKPVSFLISAGLLIRLACSWSRREKTSISVLYIPIPFLAPLLHTLRCFLHSQLICIYITCIYFCRYACRVVVSTCGEIKRTVLEC